MGLFKWIYEPLNRWQEGNYEIVQIKPGTPGYTGPKQQMFRPTRFDEYIGQGKAKRILKSYIQATKERARVMPHTLLYGKPGMGKTTLAKIIANELAVPFQEMVTSSVSNTYDLIGKINALKGGVLFMDEIHAIDRTVAESIYSIMEDFKYNGQDIRPFTLIGATTELGELLKTRKPFVDRFKIPIELSDYTLTELATLIRQYRNMTFPADTCDLSLYDIIASNCRRTPRIAIRLLESAIYLHGKIDEVLDNFDVIFEGYTTKDLEVLQYLDQAPVTLKGVQTGVGVEDICMRLGTSRENYVQLIEPYLVQNALIQRTGRGRKITQAGKVKIIELEKALVK